MQNASGTGSQQAPVGNVPPTSNQQTQASQAKMRKSTRFGIYLLKIIGACILAVFAFHSFEIVGLCLVALVLIGLFTLNKQSSGKQATPLRSVKGFGTIIAELLGMAMTICGVVAFATGLTHSKLFLAEDIVMIALGLILWIQAYRYLHKGP